MPGTIQSIERAAAMLRLLGSAGRPLGARRGRRAAGPPRPTAHGILRTLREVGFVDQDRDTGRYTLAAGLRRLGSGWDRHDLRSRAMNWADSLAGSAGQEVLLGMPAGRGRAGAPRLPARRLAAAPADRRAPSAARDGRRQVPARLRADRGAPAARARPAAATPGAPSSPSARSPSSWRRPGSAVGWPSWGSTGRGSAGWPHPCAREAGSSSARWASRGRWRSCSAVVARRCRAWPSSCSTRRGRSRPGWGRPDDRRVVAAIDQGTTSTRCLLFNPAGRMVAVAQREHRQHYPRSGWVEHDAEEIWRNVTRIVPAALRSAGLGPENIVALGIANQRETTVIWDRHTGTPLARAITWQDTRTDGILARLVDDGSAARSPSAAGCRWPPTSPAPGCAGCSTTSRVREPAPRPATCCSARWRAGWCGASPAVRTAARTSRTSPTPAARCSWTSRPGRGTRSC